MIQLSDKTTYWKELTPKFVEASGIGTIVNVSGKSGFLVGIAQWCTSGNASGNATIQVVIDGVALNPGLINFTIMYDGTSGDPNWYVPNSVGFIHPFNNSLQIIVAGDGSPNTFASYLLEE